MRALRCMCVIASIYRELYVCFHLTFTRSLKVDGMSHILHMKIVRFIKVKKRSPGFPASSVFSFAFSLGTHGFKVYIIPTQGIMGQELEMKSFKSYLWKYRSISLTVN